MIELKNVLAVVMAKQPAPGRVKTRLVSPEITPEMAAAIARAMLRCIVRRLEGFGELILAVTPDDCAVELTDQLEVGPLTTIKQGEGDLGERLARIWRGLDPQRPVAFFGMDSPDVPLAALEEIPRVLNMAQVAVGTTGDGGYWTLAAEGHHPEVLAGIDWGSQSVYDQTLRRAKEAGLTAAALPRWDDVDLPADLANLRQRLRLESPPVLDPALSELAETLDSIMTSS